MRCVLKLLFSVLSSLVAGLPLAAQKPDHGGQGPP